MALDNAKNFAKVTVSTGYNNAATSIVLNAGNGALLPTAPFNVVWWNSTDYPDPSDDPNVEIVRVTAISTDTLTVTRGQESTSGSNKNTGGKTYKMIAGLTAKVINTDLPKGLYATGTTTRASNAATGNQTIAHGLGVTPLYIRISCVYHDSANTDNLSQCQGSYNGTTGAVIYSSISPSAAASLVGASSHIIVIAENGALTNFQVADPTFDATNITLAWAKTGTLNNDNIQIFWEAWA